MVINESAYYHGKLWCAYELKDHFGNYKEELRLHMRKESQERKFTCPDCNQPLILCAGPIMEPFFKHYETNNCIINRREVNRRNLVARRMLFHLAKDSFEDATIELNKKLKEKVIPDIFIQTPTHTLVFEYLSYEIKLNAWEEKHQYYQENGITDVWFLNYKHYQYETKTTFEYMVSRTTKVLKFIDYEEGSIILKEKCKRKNGQEQLVAKSYPIEEIRIDEEGIAICDYEQYKAELLSLIEYEEQLDQLRVRDEANKRNQIFKEAIESDTYEQISLFGLMEEEKKPKGQQPQPVMNQKVVPPQLQQGLERKVVSVQPQDVEERERGVVRRYSIEDGNVSKRTMKMNTIDELWELPELIGAPWQVRGGDQKRYLYLKNLNQELKCLSLEEKREKILDAIEILETNLDASLWR